MVFAHGFGCDSNMWRFVAPHYEFGGTPNEDDVAAIALRTSDTAP